MSVFLFFFCWLDWNSGIYRRIMGKTFKILFSETARPTAYRFMSWIIYVISVLFLLCFRASMMPCGHLMGKGWPRGSQLWCLIVKLSLSHCNPGSGVVLGCIDSWSLSISYFVVTYIDTAIHAPGVYTSHRVISFYWIKMGGLGNFKKSSLKPWHPQLVVP